MIANIRNTLAAHTATPLLLTVYPPGPVLRRPDAENRQADLKITGIRNTEGNIRVALRTDENTIVDAKVVEIDPKTLTAEAVFDNLPEGTYGVAVIHDENKNEKLDFNDAGMPIEGYGHSNNPAKRPGPPNFDETNSPSPHPAQPSKSRSSTGRDCGVPQIMNVRLLISALILATAWSCAHAQDPPPAEESSLSTRYSLAVIDDATFYSDLRQPLRNPQPGPRRANVRLSAITTASPSPPASSASPPRTPTLFRLAA